MTKISQLFLVLFGLLSIVQSFFGSKPKRWVANSQTWYNYHCPLDSVWINTESEEEDFQLLTDNNYDLCHCWWETGEYEGNRWTGWIHNECWRDFWSFTFKTLLGKDELSYAAQMTYCCQSDHVCIKSKTDCDDDETGEFCCTADEIEAAQDQSVSVPTIPQPPTPNDDTLFTIQLNASTSIVMLLLLANCVVMAISYKLCRKKSSGEHIRYNRVAKVVSDEDSEQEFI